MDRLGPRLSQDRRKLGSEPEPATIAATAAAEVRLLTIALNSHADSVQNSCKTYSTDSLAFLAPACRLKEALIVSSGCRWGDTLAFTGDYLLSTVCVTKHLNAIISSCDVCIKLIWSNWSADR